MPGMFLAGVLCTLAILLLAWLGVRGWRQAFPPPPPQPQTPAQLTNERAYEHQQASHPTVRQMPVRRRYARGHHRKPIGYGHDSD